MLVHLTCAIGFQTKDSITILQLIRHGFTNQEVVGLATVSFPCELLCGAFLGMTFRRNHPFESLASPLSLQAPHCGHRTNLRVPHTTLHHNPCPVVFGTCSIPAEQIYGDRHVCSAVCFSQSGGRCQVWRCLHDCFSNVGGPIP